MSLLSFLRRSGVRSEPDISDSLEPFWASLSTTISWCLPLVDANNPAGCLRSHGSRPRLFTTSHLNTVNEALRQRYPSAPRASVEPGDLRGGRLLVYFPDQDLADGAAEAESRGFLDVNNAPPWDTWVAFVQVESPLDGSHLISWVPPQFIALVDAGIRVNPEECIKWLENANLELGKPLTDRLHSRA